MTYATLGRFAWLLVVLILCAPLASASAADKDKKPEPVHTALVVYSHNDKLAYGQAGRLYAILLRNLIGHFDVEIEIASVETVQNARVAAADAVFFVGFIEDYKLSSEFVRTMVARSKPTVWFGFGIDKAIEADTGGKLGLAYVGKRGFDKPVPASGENPGFFDTIDYKGLTFTKYYKYNPGTKVVAADPECVVVHVANAKRAETIVEMSDSVSGARAPFATRSGAFWFFTEAPFSYVGPRDRVLVLADLLFDIMGHEGRLDEHRALIRLEDVHPYTRPAAIDRLSAYLQGRQVPFSLAVVPFYRDPYGLAGRPLKDTSLDDIRAIPLVEALKRALARGGSIVQHGTTHQFGALKNPNSGISGDDFEFWDAVNDKPIAELESDDAMRARIMAGKATLERQGLTPFAFEVPHYQASPLTYRAIASIYAATYQRVTYYSNEDGKVGSDARSEAALGQEFPFVVKRDHYGQMVLPENIGNLQYAYPVQSVDDLLRNADYAKTVRGGYASFFFHPFFLEGGQAEKAMADLDRLITGLQARGFRFVSAEAVARETAVSRERLTKPQ